VKPFCPVSGDIKLVYQLIDLIGPELSATLIFREKREFHVTIGYSREND